MHPVLEKLVTDTLDVQAKLTAVCPKRTGGISINLREYSEALGHDRLRSKRFEEIQQAFGTVGLSVTKLPSDHCAVEFDGASVERLGDFIFVKTANQSSRGWKAPVSRV
jgi:hypothetical protein